MADGTNPVLMLDLGPLHASMRAELDAAIRTVLDRGQFVLGEEVAAFEREAAAWLGVRHAVAVASGTDALLLALKAAGIGHGDEVITTGFTFFATVEAIRLAEATPVFADIDPETLTLDAGDARKCITPRTRAILPVHLFGHVADMNAILALADEHAMIVIEDAAQAFGARRDGQAAGSFGLAGAFSFHPTKPLGALGDGGLVATGDDNIAAEVRLLRNHGASAHHRHERIGCNSRLDELQAAVLRVKLRHLERHLAARERIASIYDTLLRDLPLQLPAREPAVRSSHAQYTLQSPQRDVLKQALDDAGIACAIHYPEPAWRQPALRPIPHDPGLPITETACRNCLSLPLYEGLLPAQQERIAAIIRRLARASRVS